MQRVWKYMMMKNKKKFFFLKKPPKNLVVSFFSIIFVSRNKNNKNYDYSGDLFGIERKRFIPRLI